MSPRPHPPRVAGPGRGHPVSAVATGPTGRGYQSAAAKKAALDRAPRLPPGVRFVGFDRGYPVHVDSRGQNVKPAPQNNKTQNLAGVLSNVGAGRDMENKLVVGSLEAAGAAKPTIAAARRYAGWGAMPLAVAGQGLLFADDLGKMPADEAIASSAGRSLVSIGIPALGTALAGAAAGSVVPGLGTVVGGAVGLGVGLGLDRMGAPEWAAGKARALYQQRRALQRRYGIDPYSTDYPYY